MPYSLDEDYGRNDAPAGRDNLFGWTIFILILIGVAFACWLGSFRIFGHPEDPRSYAILKKLGKIDPPKKFELTKAPPGEFLNAKKLYDRYSTFTNLELQRENELLLRNYLRNYSDTKKLVPYLVGKFAVMDSRELQESDMFPSGVVALAQPEEYQNVVIEHLFPAVDGNVTGARANLVTGADLQLKKSLDLSAVIHVDKMYDGRFLFTVMPLLYGRYAANNESGGFELEPPSELNLAAGAPIMKDDLLQEAFRTFAEYQRKTRGRTASSSSVGAASTPTPPPALVSVESTPEPLIAQATPVAAEETPVPVARAIPLDTPRPVASATPAQIAMNATPTPTPTPIPVAIAQATPRPTPAGEVPLQPFLVSANTPAPQATGAGSWRVYGAGEVPAGRLVDVRSVQAGAANRTAPDDRIYLEGDFVVTAAGDNRAVLRSREATRVARVIVSFPSGSRPPVEGSSVSRDGRRPFEVTDVREGADGITNIYVREITAP